MDERAADEEKETFENKWNPRTIWYAPHFLFTDSQRQRCTEERLILRSSPCDLVSSSTCLMITLKRFSLCLPLRPAPPRPVQHSQSHSAYRPIWLVSDWSRHVDGKLQLIGPSTKKTDRSPDEAQWVWNKKKKKNKSQDEWSFSSPAPWLPSLPGFLNFKWARRSGSAS